MKEIILALLLVVLLSVASALGANAVVDQYGVVYWVGPDSKQPGSMEVPPIYYPIKLAGWKDQDMQYFRGIVQSMSGFRFRVQGFSVDNYKLDSPPTYDTLIDMLTGSTYTGCPQVEPTGAIR